MSSYLERHARVFGLVRTVVLRQGAVVPVGNAVGTDPVGGLLVDDRAVHGRPPATRIATAADVQLVGGGLREVVGVRLVTARSGKGGVAVPASRRVDPDS